MAPTVIFIVLTVTLIAKVIAKPPQKIVNGNSAILGEFPYQASLRIRGHHYCGGAIVSSRHIITAAHCVANLHEPLTVVTGTISSSNGEVHTSTDIHYHRQYQSGVATSPFDIAVITLDDEITFNTAQNKINLPTAPAPIGVMATVSGWGYTNASVPIVTPSLNKINLPTISYKKCQEMFGSSINIYSNQVCTYRGPGFGICRVDSGGPLVYNNELIGVASYGTACAIGDPDVFTSIYHLLPWVNYTINASLLKLSDQDET